MTPSEKYHTLLKEYQEMRARFVSLCAGLEIQSVNEMVDNSTAAECQAVGKMIADAAKLGRIFNRPKETGL